MTSEKVTFSVVNGPSKGHYYRSDLKKKGTIIAVNGRKRAPLTRCTEEKGTINTVNGQ